MTMPKPFLHGIQVGVDICCVSRIERLLNLTSPSKAIWRGINTDETSNGQTRDSMVNESSTLNSKKIDISCRTKQKQRFLRRLFTPYEEFFYQLTRPHIFRDMIDLQPSLNNYKFIAGRFSAKEAIIKAIRYRQLSFHDIIVLPRHVELPNIDKNMNYVKPVRSESPRAVVLAPRRDFATSKKLISIGIEHSSTQKEKALNFGVSFEEYIEDMRRWEKGEEVQLNISHDGDYAVSVCLAPSLSKE